MNEEHELPSLAERFPDYVKTFGIGLAASAAIGVVAGLISGAHVVVAFANVVMALGVVYLLAGGARGGGYTNMGAGAAAALFGGRNQTDEDVEDEDVRMGGGVKAVYSKRRTHDPMTRLQKGLRPGANPSAFWQVVGGFGYLAVGLVLLTQFG